MSRGSEARPNARDRTVSPRQRAVLAALTELETVGETPAELTAVSEAYATFLDDSPEIRNMLDLKAELTALVERGAVRATHHVDENSSRVVRRYAVGSTADASTSSRRAGGRSKTNEV